MAIDVYRFAACAFLFCVVMAAQEKSPHLNGPPTGRPPMKDTAINENGFKLTLPGKWTADASDDPTRGVTTPIMVTSFSQFHYWSSRKG